MSTGLYSHTTRATGIILTAAIYNADHQNHITNQNPTMTGALSDNLTEHQSVMDPGGLGTEVLAASLAEELQQLRFAIKRITGKTQWYIAPLTDLESVGGTIVDLLVSETARFTGDLTPSTITANQNNYAPTNHADAFRFRLASDASRDITGLAGGASGRVIVVENIGSFDIVIRSENAASTAGNRFLLPGDLTIRTKHSFAFHYDGTLSRWVPFHSALPANPILDGSLTRSSYEDVLAIAAPGSPAANNLRYYTKDTGAGVLRPAYKNSAGVETVIGAGAPTFQIFTASGTWNKPAGLAAAIVHVIGGGGASGGTAGTGLGGTSSFGAHCSATGGSNDLFGGAIPGVGSGGDINMSGGRGGGSTSGVCGGVPGPFGAPASFGSGATATGLNYGGGADNASSAQGHGGGYSMKRIAAGSLGATETVTVGAGGVRTGTNNASGGPGIVIVEEYYG